MRFRGVGLYKLAVCEGSIPISGRSAKLKLHARTPSSHSQSTNFPWPSTRIKSIQSPEQVLFDGYRTSKTSPGSTHGRVGLQEVSNHHLDGWPEQSFYYICSELKRRANKAAKAEKASEAASKAPVKQLNNVKQNVASEDDLTPNVSEVLRYSEVCVAHLVITISNTLSCARVRSRSFAKRKNPIRTRTNTMSLSHCRITSTSMGQRGRFQQERSLMGL